ncbi:MAG: hypothetical protein GTN99_04390, partial [Candidatus Dadabacteria bacterium]|nr:hypothetical protein [Candidatus Dadabacteria bacterium]
MYLRLSKETKEENYINKCVNASKEYQSLNPGSYAENNYNEVTQNLNAATMLLEEILNKPSEPGAYDDERDIKTEQLEAKEDVKSEVEDEI